MCASSKCLSLVVVFLSGLMWSEAGQQKDGADEVEIQFANGSKVRMTLFGDHLEIQSRYGKLVVPTRDIRQIEFGVHLPDGADKRIDKAIKSLGSENFKERDAAVKDLVELGAYAFPAVSAAAKSANPEIAQRAQSVLKRLQAKVPAKELRTREDDRVVTPAFTIVGRIVTPNIKAQSEYFGDVQLKLAQLRTLRRIKGPSETDVSVDAAKYAGHGTWLATDVDVEPGMTLAITASGQVDLWPQQPGQYLTGPAGYGQGGGALMMINGRIVQQRGAAGDIPGALMGRIGESGEVFVVGERYEGTPAGEGRLYLHIGPSPWQNASSGSYKVRISAK